MAYYDANGEKPIIVILTASSGGGHNAAARALIERIGQVYRDFYDFRIIDIYESQVTARLAWLARLRYQTHTLWRWFLACTDNRYSVALITALMRPYMLRTIKKALPRDCSHLIAVHFNPAQLLHHVAKSFEAPPKTAILVTDFDPHWAWIGKQCDRVLVVSDRGVNRFKALGYQHQSITQLPFLPTRRLPQRTLQERVAVTLSFLLVSGQDGANPQRIIALVQLLDQLSNDTQIELRVVCGHNQRLKAQLEHRVKEGLSVQLSVFGYCPDLAEQIQSADMVLLRTSPGVLSECISAAVPVMGFDWTEHEAYQCQLIHAHGIGKASRSPQVQRAFLTRVIHDQGYLLRLRENIGQLRCRMDYDRLVSELLGRTDEACP